MIPRLGHPPAADHDLRAGRSLLALVDASWCAPPVAALVTAKARASRQHTAPPLSPRRHRPRHRAVQPSAAGGRRRRSAMASERVLLELRAAPPGAGCARSSTGRARDRAGRDRAEARGAGRRIAGAAEEAGSAGCRTQEHEDASWQGLVKLYEAMKPRDAATIFNDLEMPVLLQVVDRMKEARRRRCWRRCSPTRRAT